jgi:hypothetical protein
VSGSFGGLGAGAAVRTGLFFQSRSCPAERLSRFPSPGLAFAAKASSSDVFAEQAVSAAVLDRKIFLQTVATYQCRVQFSGQERAL